MNQELQKILNNFHELEQQILDPAVLNDTARLKKISMEYSEQKTLVEKISLLDSLEKQLAENEKIISEEKDTELKALAAEELTGIKSAIILLEAELTALIKPQDPRDKKDVIVEIRAGAGGDEASIFAGELFRLYARFAERQGWKTHLLSASRLGIDGFKEVIFEVASSSLAKGGQGGVYKTLKYESGVHRVQRVPETEKSGRVHTSTATVAVLPVAEDVEIEVKPEDIKLDVYRSSGPGGQSVNTTDSAVRITHKPSGLVVACQDEKSQLQNREKAMRLLKTKLLQMQQEKRDQEERAARQSQVGSGMRSEKIRTYNFPQDRLTDHRIKQNWHNLPNIMDGNIGEIIDSLKKTI